MNINNHYPFEATVQSATDLEGYECAALMLKATYLFPSKPGGSIGFAVKQAPWFYADSPLDETGLGGVLHEADLPFEKPHPEFLVAGQAHAPEGKPTERFLFGVSVGQQVKAMVAVGARTWHAGLLGKASPIEPILSLPASYAHGFGGADPTKMSEDDTHWCRSNHAGTGYCSSPASKHADGMRLPQLEPANARFAQPCTRFTSLGLGPVARNWVPRVQWAGTYDEQWRDQRWPRLPADFDARYFQSAVQDQWLPELVTDQPIVLINMTAASSVYTSELRFKLPLLDYHATVHPRRGNSTRVQLRPDTLVIEPDAGRFSIIARKQFPLVEGLHEIESVTFGNPRRRLTQSKPSTGSLGELVRQVNQRRAAGRRH